MRTLTTRTPQRQLSSLHAEMDELLGRSFGEEAAWAWPPRDALTPAVESFVTDGELVVRADLPGIDRQVDTHDERVGQDGDE